MAAKPNTKFKYELRGLEPPLALAPVTISIDPLVLDSEVSIVIEPLLLASISRYSSNQGNTSSN